jgi:ribose transport system permease protein
MSQQAHAEKAVGVHTTASRAMRLGQHLFVKLGVLPFLLLLALVVFTAMSGNFLTTDNLVNVVRQSVYLTIVALGQMLALLTGGFDLSVGTIVALTSVVGATAMAAVSAASPDTIWLAIVLGCLAGIAAGTLVGVTNGIGVSVFNVSPFMMTLGIASVGFGIALYMTSGMPVYGMPKQFGAVFGFGRFVGVPVPVIAALIIIALTWVLINRTALGRYFYAVGGNIKAAQLSGISTGRILFLTYMLCGFLSSVCGMLLTARLETGEANIGHSLPLESIAACVIGGVSLRGGVGRVGNVVLGALFIGLVQNGMNLARIESYLQTVVLGVLLIFAVIADQLRLRVIASLRD